MQAATGHLHGRYHGGEHYVMQLGLEISYMLSAYIFGLCTEMLESNFIRDFANFHPSWTVVMWQGPSNGNL